ncbi:MAG: thioredoxin domain-containing protein, partial [Firmicutes bacterium]|nr:thioredoxin domain-containing protein [Bacillota bacterium]
MGSRIDKRINWQKWGEKAFAKAREENKPILLSISGSWCHWCHVMDDTTYSDQEVVEKINQDYVPIRVDTDLRPDINARYNLGGWPTTAFLTPEGEIISGGTYIPPDSMLETLEDVYHVYRQDSAGIKEKSRRRSVLEQERTKPPHKMTTRTEEKGRETETFADLIGFASDQVRENYDPQYGGFGRAPKFPMVDALELTQVAYLYEADREWENIFRHTLRSMFEGGVYDSVEGGFFRYSTTRDWNIPHFEKMLEDNAQLLHVLLTAYKLTADELFARASRDILRYLEANLYLPKQEGWAGSQDADENYYSLPMSERTKRAKPGIDRTIYVGWNALLIRSLFLAAVVLEEPKWFDRAMAALKMLQKHCYLKGKGMAHYLAEEG